MSRNNIRVSNERKTKANKTKAQSKEVKDRCKDRCKDLLTALTKRSNPFVTDCEKFSEASNKFVIYCEGCNGRADMSASILNIFVSYITIYVYFWKQYIYLNDGICSFQYQLEESLDKIITVRNTMKHEASALIQMNIEAGGQDNFTDTSVEGIYNFYASNNLHDDDFLMVFESTVKDKLQAEGKNITNSVKRVVISLREKV